MADPVQEELQRPASEVGTALLGLPENQWFERKSARIRARELAETLIGFANAEGGVVVVGLSDGEVEGIARSPDRQNDWRQAAVDHSAPPVPVRLEELDCINADGDDDVLLVIEVDASDRVHTNMRDEAFLRLGDETRRLTFDQRRELEFDKGQSNYEVTPARRTARDDLDDQLLADVADRIGHPDPDRLLAARGLIDREGRVTVGAALLFGREPQAEHPEAYVRILRYRGVQRGTGRRQQILEDLRVEGPLPQQIEQVRGRISALMPTRRALRTDGTFADVGAVPHDAWLEGLVNAVTHRSYSMMGDHIRVELFDDRLEIESPGRFPGIVEVSDPTAITRFARNPRIARVLADLDIGQELGEGIRRMFEEMRLAGLAEPLYHQTAGSVRLILSAEPIDRALEERLPATARAVVRAIRERDRASTGDLMGATGRSRPAVLTDLRLLRDEGVIEWVGTSKKDPRAYWRLRVE